MVWFGSFQCDQGAMLAELCCSKMNMNLEEMPLTQLSVPFKKSKFGLHLRKLALLYLVSEGFLEVL